jgi:hypothetical protein
VVDHMNGMHDGQFQTDIEKLFSPFYILAFLFALATVSLTLWWIWTHHASLRESAVQAFFCATFIWMWVSMFQCYRALRQLGLSPEGRKQLFSSPRPNDLDELRAWLWFRRFLLSVLTLLLFMCAIPFVL